MHLTLVLKLHWSDFHLSSPHRVVVTFPGMPVYSISKRWVLPMMIQSIQVRRMTVLVPPRSFVSHSTVTTIYVIILIFGWKGIATMIRKRIAGSSWKIHSKSVRRVRWWLNCTGKSEFSIININSLFYFQSGPECEIPSLARLVEWRQLKQLLPDNDVW